MPPVKKATKVKEKAPPKNQAKKVKGTLVAKSSKSTKKSKVLKSKVQKCKTTNSKEQKSKATKSKVQKCKTTNSKEQKSKATKAKVQKLKVQKAISKKPKAQKSKTKEPKVQKTKKEVKMKTPVKSVKKKAESEKKGVKAVKALPKPSKKAPKKEKENTPVPPKPTISQKDPLKDLSVTQKSNTAPDQNFKITCFSCDKTVLRDSINSHLFFGPMKCGACYLKISKCVDFAEIWHKNKMNGKLIEKEGNQVLTFCSKSQTGIHESLEWEDCIIFLRYYIEKDIMISNFCSNSTAIPLAKDIHNKMSEYMTKLSELENEEPWKLAFVEYKNYCKEFEQVLKKLPQKPVVNRVVLQKNNIEAKSQEKAMPNLKNIKSEKAAASAKKQTNKNEDVRVFKASVSKVADQSSPRIKDKNVSKGPVTLEKQKNILTTSENKSTSRFPDCNMNKLPVEKRKIATPKRKKNGLKSDDLSNNYEIPVDTDSHSSVGREQDTQKVKDIRSGTLQESSQETKKLKISSAKSKASKKLPFIPADDHFLVINYPKETCPEECPVCYSGFIPDCVTMSCSLDVLTIKCKTCGISIFILHEN